MNVDDLCKCVDDVDLKPNHVIALGKAFGHFVIATLVCKVCPLTESYVSHV